MIEWIKRMFRGKTTGFGLVMPRPEGGATKYEWQLYKTYMRLNTQRRWADPMNWRD